MAAIERPPRNGPIKRHFKPLQFRFIELLRAQRNARETNSENPDQHRGKTEATQPRPQKTSQGGAIEHRTSAF